MHRPQFARILTLSLIALTAACGDDKVSDGAPDAGGSGDTAADANGLGSGSGEGSADGSGLIDADLRTAPDYRLSAAATVKRDAQGTAHIYGANLNDAVFAQG